MDYGVIPVSSQYKGKTRLKDRRPEARRDFSREPRGKKARDTKSRDPSVESRQDGSIKPRGYFICDGPHRARECPKRKGVAALVTADDSEGEQPARLAPLQLQ